MLYLDARSTFINALRKLLLRNLCFAATDGEAGKHIKSWINKQWDRSFISMESGKIFGKIQLQMAQSYQLEVQLSKNLIISAIGQANETPVISNNIHSLQSLCQVFLYYCSKFHMVETHQDVHPN